MLVATQKPYTSGPTIRSQYQWTPNSSSYPSPVTVTVPSEAVVGDFFIIATCNATTIQTNNTSITMRSIYSPQATGTYTEYTTMHWGVVTSGSAGGTMLLVAGGFQFSYHTLLLTNPNQSFVGNGTVIANNGTSSVGWQTGGSASSGNVTSLTDGSPTTKSGTLSYTPGSVRVKSWGYNGASSWPYYSSYTGGGTVYAITDSYWYRGTAVCVEANASTTTGTFNISGSSAAIAHTEILII